MKILAQAIPNNTISGFAKAAVELGHDWIWWEESHVPAFDAFDELKPDMFIGMQITLALAKCLQTAQIPIVIGSVDKPFVFKLTTQSKTQEFDFKYLVDHHNFYVDDMDDALRCDFGIVCGPCPEGLNICREPLNVKILSELPWSVSQYLGVGSLNDKRRLYCSTKKVLVDNIIEVLRVIACGSMPIYCGEDDKLPTPWNKFHNTCIPEEQYATVIQEHQELLHNHTYENALKKIISQTDN
jgi:hypothetical protein